MRIKPSSTPGLITRTRHPATTDAGMQPENPRLNPLASSCPHTCSRRRVQESQVGKASTQSQKTTTIAVSLIVIMTTTAMMIVMLRVLRVRLFI